MGKRKEIHTMKKALSSLLIVVMLAGSVPSAFAEVGELAITPTTQLLTFNGDPVELVAAYNINEENYFKLRDIAKLVNIFDIDWSGDKSAISVILDKPYTPNGTESTEKPTGYNDIQLSADKVFIGDTELALTVYKIDGANYFRLKDLGTNFGFGVAYDVPTATIQITTQDANPTTPEPTATPAPNGQLTITEVTTPVKKNEFATLTAFGKPDTEYTISVYYRSGASTAAGLEKQTSDANGQVSWTWKVGGSTSLGTYRIVVKGGDEQTETTFEVVQS
jgi:hypothetical protein